MLMDCLLGRHNLGYKRVHKINQISGLTVCQSLSPPHCRRICCLHLSLLLPWWCYHQLRRVCVCRITVSSSIVLATRFDDTNQSAIISICIWRSRIQGTVIGTNERAMGQKGFTCEVNGVKNKEKIGLHGSGTGKQ